MERNDTAELFEDTPEDTPMLEDTPEDTPMLEDTIAPMSEDTPASISEDTAVSITEDIAHLTVVTNDELQWTDPYSYEVFSEFQPRNGWFKIKAVRVQFVYKDVQGNQLYLFLLDKNRDRIIAVVPSGLMEIYEPMNLEGGVFSIESFQFYPIGSDDFPRYQSYSLHRDDYELRFYKKTKLTPLESTSVGFELPYYPKFYSFGYLQGVKVKMLIDVVGKIVRGELKSFRDQWNSHRSPYLELVLKDFSGQELKVKLYDPWSLHLPGPLARAIQNHLVIFITRVKLDPTREKNVLICTGLSTIELEPTMPEADDMGRLLI